ncbi:MAG: MFS transporter [Candidatus Obscuribacterales bacterium]|nr:MFS transporter [Candidatus Obscuribacterales bacterium]
MIESSSIAQRLERLPITGYQRLIFAVIATAWFFDCLDVAMMTFVLSSIKSEFSLTSAAAGTLASVSFLGMFVGAGLAGLLADRFGRCLVFRWSIVIWGLSSLACALAPDITTLMIFRVFLGMGMAMELPVGQSLVCEFIPAKNRGKYIALLEGAWPLGFIAAGILAHFILPVYGWRGAFIAEAIPALFVLVVRQIVPESPRWLVATGNTKKACEIVSNLEKKVMEKLGVSSLKDPQVIKLESKNFKDETHPFKQLFKGVYRKRTIMLWCLWFFALLGYYGITTWLGALLEDRGFSMARSTDYIILISLAGVPGFLTTAWLIEILGRKPIMVATLLGSATAAYFYGTAGSEALLIGFGLTMQFFMFGMWSVLYAYTPELYPTHARATGAGFASSIGRLGALLGPFLIGYILPLAGQVGVFAFSAGAFVLAALAVIVLGKETRGLVLEDI